MTEQEAFDKAVAGLASQGFERCGIKGDNLIDDFECLYNLGDMHCAAGWVFPMDLTVNREGTQARRIARDEAGFSKIADFLGELQGAHDNAETPEQMRQRLLVVGRQYGLSIPAALLEAA